LRQDGKLKKKFKIFANRSSHKIHCKGCVVLFLKFVSAGKLFSVFTGSLPEDPLLLLGVDHFSAANQTIIGKTL
jgi:hypothetical protein